MSQKGLVLVVAGSDSGGGAGIQADIKSIQAQGAYATTAISALTAQNTLGVQDIFPVPPGFIVAQINSILSDIGTHICKTGMLAARPVIEAVAERLDGLPIVVDPVMVATSGDKLLQDEAVGALSSLLVHRAFVVTPNLPEASLLVRRDVETPDDMKRAADTLMEAGSHAALIKGGHMSSSGGSDKVVTDLLATQSGFHVFEHERLETTNTHGTGCTLASALSGQLANVMLAGAENTLDDKGRPTDAALVTATEAALAYVHHAIKSAPDNIGSTSSGGNGPLNHGVT